MCIYTYIHIYLHTHAYVYLASLKSFIPIKELARKIKESAQRNNNEDGENWHLYWLAIKQTKKQ